MNVADVKREFNKQNLCVLVDGNAGFYAGQNKKYFELFNIAWNKDYAEVMTMEEAEKLQRHYRISGYNFEIRPVFDI